MAVSVIQGNIDSGWKQIPLRSGVSLNVALYRVKNGVCYCTIADVGVWSYSGGSWVAFADLPAEARPTTQNVYGSFSARAGHVGEWRILPSGAIEIFAPTSANEFSFNAVFPIP